MLTSYVRLNPKHASVNVASMPSHIILLNVRQTCVRITRSSAFTSIAVSGVQSERLTFWLSPDFGPDSSSENFLDSATGWSLCSSHASFKQRKYGSLMNSWHNEM